MLTFSQVPNLHLFRCFPVLPTLPTQVSIRVLVNQFKHLVTVAGFSWLQEGHTYLLSCAINFFLSGRELGRWLSELDTFQLGMRTWVPIPRTHMNQRMVAWVWPEFKSLESIRIRAWLHGYVISVLLRQKDGGGRDRRITRISRATSLLKVVVSN